MNIWRVAIIDRLSRHAHKKSKIHRVGMKTTGSLDVYSIHPDFGMAGVNVLPAKVTWQDKYWLTSRTQKNIYFLCHRAFSRLPALKTSNLVEKGSHSPLRFPLFERVRFSNNKPISAHSNTAGVCRYTTASAKVKHTASKPATKRDRMCKFTMLFVVI